MVGTEKEITALDYANLFRITSNKETKKINYLMESKFGIKKFDNLTLQSTETFSLLAV